MQICFQDIIQKFSAHINIQFCICSVGTEALEKVHNNECWLVNEPKCNLKQNAVRHCCMFTIFPIVFPLLSDLFFSALRFLQLFFLPANQQHKKKFHYFCSTTMLEYIFLHCEQELYIADCNFSCTLSLSFSIFLLFSFFFCCLI